MEPHVVLVHYPVRDLLGLLMMFVLNIRPLIIRSDDTIPMCASSSLFQQVLKKTNSRVLIRTDLYAVSFVRERSVLSVYEMSELNQPISHLPVDSCPFDDVTPKLLAGVSITRRCPASEFCQVKRVNRRQSGSGWFDCQLLPPNYTVEL